MAGYCKTSFSGNRHGRRDMVRLNARGGGARHVGMAMAMNGEEGKRVERTGVGKGEGVSSKGTQRQQKVSKSVDLDVVSSGG
jgi:hypothetical protein